MQKVYIMKWNKNKMGEKKPTVCQFEYYDLDTIIITYIMEYTNLIRTKVVRITYWSNNQITIVMIIISIWVFVVLVLSKFSLLVVIIWFLYNIQIVLFFVIHYFFHWPLHLVFLIFSYFTFMYLWCHCCVIVLI